MNIIYDDLQPVRRPHVVHRMLEIGQRYRNTDPDTSQEAAKAARGWHAQWQRDMILAALRANPEGYTAKELAHRACIRYHDVQRRISEVRGIKRNGEKRDGSAVWVAVETA